MLGREECDPEGFRFRGLHPHVDLGTASDRYAGWIGQIYSAERYRVTRRKKTVGGRSFIEEVLPVESVEEYFRHFSTLEVDYTFYGLLLDVRGAATPNLRLLRSYHTYMQEGDQVLVKVPQVIFAQKLRQGGRYVANGDYLNGRLFTEQFYQPAVAVLGDNLAGFIFEQEYQRHAERASVPKLVADLEGFFRSIPRDERYHVELRTEAYLCRPVFELFEAFGLGQVLSHWTWLPSPAHQLARAGHRFPSAGHQSVIRLLTPIGTRYEDAYALAHPFNRLIEGMHQPKMVEETAELMWEGIRQGTRMHVIVNNRAGGNAPLIAQQIARRFNERAPAVP